jgi:protein SCO1
MSSALRSLLVCLLLATSLASPACKRRQVFQVRGTVEEVLPDGDKVRLAHERIPGYMEAMTMVFDVKRTNELAGISAGDIVSFRMVVTSDDGWIEDLKRIGKAPPKPAPPPMPESTRVVKDVEELQVGDKLPDYRFTNQLGQAISTGDFRGRALAFTFIFTRCPFPVYCPRMSGNFAAVQRQLKQMPDAPTNWHLLTISFDAAHDTPALLKAYAEGYQHDPAHWTFATGDAGEISALGDHFGLLFWWPDPKDRGNISHNVRTVVLDPQGLVQKIYTDNEWKVDDLAAELVKAARKSS